ncbi:hypothetical protein GF386_03355 [Candidatus Pacearchaeota archaeon]|nr:hypothetical protein [Candidatus Pacearchaeota archaeon]MBD3283178.1 hypothetical protein [Candidatus Pacearchaeota archaeon]
MKKFIILFLVFLSCISLVFSLSPESSGSYETSLYSDSFQASNGLYTLNVYYPESGGNYPAIIFCPGIGTTKVMYKWFGYHLSSHGYVVLIFTPPISFFRTSETRIEGIVKSIDYLEEKNNKGQLKGKIDLDKLGVAGHAAGGTAVINTMPEDIRIKLGVVFSPSCDGKVINKAEKIKNPVQIQAAKNDIVIKSIISEKCYDNLNTVKEYVEINNGNHFIFTEVGIYDNTIIKKYSLSWFNYFLKNERNYHSYLFGEEAENDIHSGLLSDLKFDNSVKVECNPDDKKECGIDVGVCEKGIQDCIGGKWSDCLGQVYPVEEICDDNLDNDCDGFVDEGCVKKIILEKEDEDKIIKKPETNKTEETPLLEENLTEELPIEENQTEPLEGEKPSEETGWNKGPYNFSVYEDSFSNGWGFYDVDIYYPESTGDFPAVIFSPGYLGSKNEYEWIGEHLASHGFITLLTSVPNRFGIILEQRVDGFESAVDYLNEVNDKKGHVLNNKIEVDNLGVAGHSYGGAATSVYLGRQNSQVKAGVALAPLCKVAVYPEGSSLDGQEILDSNIILRINEVQKERMKSSITPIQIQAGEKDIICPPENNLVCYDNLINSDRMFIEIKGADHHQFSDPGVAYLMPGGIPGISLKKQQEISSKYFASWFYYYLKGDEEYKKYVDGTEAKNDINNDILLEYRSDEGCVGDECLKIEAVEELKTFGENCTEHAECVTINCEDGVCKFPSFKKEERESIISLIISIVRGIVKDVLDNEEIIIHIKDRDYTLRIDEKHVDEIINRLKDRYEIETKEGEEKIIRRLKKAGYIH